MLLNVARQVFGHGPARGRGARRRRDRLGLLRTLALVDMQLFEFKLKLVDLMQQLFRLLAEHLALELKKQQHQARSEEHTSELQSLMRISYAVFCLKKKQTMHKKIQ